MWNLAASPRSAALELGARARARLRFQLEPPRGLVITLAARLVAGS